MQTIGTFHAGKMSKLDSPLGEGTVSIVLSYSARQPMSSIFTERGKKSVLVFLNRVISVEKIIDYITPFVTAYVTFCLSVLFTTAYFETWSLPPTVLLARDN